MQHQQQQQNTEQLLKSTCLVVQIQSQRGL